MLKPAKDLEEFLLHKAALEWGLADQIIINKLEDIKSRSMWQENVTPYEHQIRNLMTFTKKQPCVLIADDVGMGKTITAGLILSEMIKRGRIKRALIICPKILCIQWSEELYSKFGISANVAVGKYEFESQVKSDCTAVVVTYQTFSANIMIIDESIFDIIILDEAHKMRNLYGSSSAPIMAINIKKTLERRFFRFVLMLTATPMHNKIWDIYSLIDLMSSARGQKNPLGSEMEFKNIYIKDKNGVFVNDDKKGDFHKIIREYIARTRRNDVELPFPDRCVETQLVELSKYEIEVLNYIFEWEIIFSCLLSISVNMALMSSHMALKKQLKNMYYGVDEDQKYHLDNLFDIIEKIDVPAKLECLIGLINKMSEKKSEDWRVVVFTSRIETKLMIHNELLKKGIKSGIIKSGSYEENNSVIKKLTCDPPKINVLVSGDSGAEGLNLQAANVLVNYDLPWNPMIIEQRIGRIQRLGSKHKSVQIINLVGKKTIEERVVARVITKLIGVNQAVGDIESIIGCIDEEGDGRGFEKIIQEMVIKSLKKQDIEKSALLVEGNILNAKKLWVENKIEIEKNLGKLGHLHESGPEVPNLTKVVPCLSIQDFVTKAKIANGVKNIEKIGDLHRFEYPDGKVELVSFEPGKFISGNESRLANFELMSPGNKNFANLIYKWSSKAHCYICEPNIDEQENIRKIIEEWICSIHARQSISFKIFSKKIEFVGNVVLKAKSYNGIDSYEKLIDKRIESKFNVNLEKISKTKLVDREIADKGDFKFIFESAEAFANTDIDILKFRKFYDERKREEEIKIVGDVYMMARISSDFNTFTISDLVGISGTKFDVLEINVDYKFGEKDKYNSVIKIVPSTLQVIEEPVRYKCVKTGYNVPEDCLSKCQSTGARALTHLLEICSVSGKRVLPDELLSCTISNQKALKEFFRTSAVSGITAQAKFFGICQVSGDNVLVDEMGTSSLTGRRVRVDLLYGSQKNPERVGLLDELVKCEITGKLMLWDEVGQSAVSGLVVDKDLLVESEYSGLKCCPDECLICPVSNVRILRSESGICSETGVIVGARVLEKSSVSGRLVCRDLLVPCGESSQLALPYELESCSKSLKKVIPSHLGECQISGRKVIKEYLLTCACSGKYVLSDLVQKSDLSGKVALPEFFLTSDKAPGRQGFKSEAAECAISGKTLLLDEMVKSQVSGKYADKDLLVKSDRSSVFGFPSEFGTCEETGRRLLPDEMGKCCVTGKVVDIDLLEPIKDSNTVALKRLFEICPVTGKKGLPSDFSDCAITGSRVHRDALGVCFHTGKRVVFGRLLTCSVTDKLVLDTETSKSDFSGRVALKQLFVASDKNPDRRGLKLESVECAISGKTLLLDETAKSKISGAYADKDLMVKSDRSSVFGIPSEFGTCEETGRRLLPDEMGKCCVTGKVVDIDLLEPIKDSNTVALKRLFEICPVTGKKGLQSDFGDCAVTGSRVHRDALGVCSLTGKRVLVSRLVKCSVTGKSVLFTEVAKSAFSGRIALKQFLIPSEKVPGRRGLRTEMEVCTITGKTLMVDEVSASEISGLAGDRDLMVRSSVSGKLVLPKESITCSESGKILLQNEAFCCPISRKYFHPSMVSQDEVTGDRYHSRLMAKCSSTGKLVLESCLETCSVTGLKHLPSEMVKSKLSSIKCYVGRAVLSEYSLALCHPSEILKCPVTSKMGLPGELALCQWTKAYMDPAQLKRCKTSKLVFYKKLIDNSGRMSILNKIIEDDENEFLSSDKLQSFLIQKYKSLNLKGNLKYKISNKGTVAFKIDLKGQWSILSKQRYLSGFIISNKFVGRCVQYYYDGDNLIEESFVDF